MYPFKRPPHSYLQDGIAGLSIVGLLLPSSVAYAGIANLPPQAGVIALFVGLICYGLMGTSRFAIVSSTSSSAAVLAASTSSLAEGNDELRLSLALGLIIITGLFFIIASFAKLGSITSFISKPVLRGLTFGLAVIIILKQLASFVAIFPEHSDLIHFGTELFAQIPRWHLPSLALGLISLILLFYLDRFKPFPSSLLVIFVSIILSASVSLPDYDVKLVGDINLSVSSPSLPHLAWDHWLRLAELGFAMVLILYSESYSSIRNFAVKHGDQVSPNRDLFVLGISNIASGIFQGMPVGAGYTGTAANEAAGAQSRLSGLMAAAIVLVVVLTIFPWFARIPQPVLAAIVIHAVSPSLNIAPIRQYFIWKRDRLICMVTIAGVLLLGILNGLFVAIALSLIMLLRKMAAAKIIHMGRLNGTHEFVDMDKFPQAQFIPYTLIVSPTQPMFFGNVDAIIGHINDALTDTQRPIDTLIISLEESPGLDSTSLEALSVFARMADEHGLVLYFASLKTPAQKGLEMIFKDQGVEARLSHFSIDESVKRAQSERIKNHPPADHT